MRIFGRCLVGACAGAALVASSDAAAKVAGPAPLTDVVAGQGAIWTWAGTYELVRIDPAADRITARTDTRPALITDLAAGAEGVWGAGICGRLNCRYGTLMRFDPATGRRIRPLIRLGLRPRAVAVGFGSVWVLGARRVLRIDPGTGRVIGAPIGIGRGGRDIAAGAGHVWVTTGPAQGPPRVSAPCWALGIHPGRARVVRRQVIPCAEPARVAVAGRRIWIATGDQARGVVQLTSGGVRLAPTAAWIAGASEAVAATPRRAWFTVRDGAGAGLLTRVDAASGAVGRPVRLGPSSLGSPLAVATGFGAVWVANAPAGTILRIDPRGRRVVARIATANESGQPRRTVRRSTGVE